jgi:hypothetical protein
MAEFHYGVVQQDGRWRIVGTHLRFGSYSLRSAAVRAARRLAKRSLPNGILHIQDETGELLPPERVDDEHDL